MRAHQRQPEAVQARSRHQEEDADHVRHARRGRGAVRRCDTRIVFSVHGDRSDGAARARRRAQRQHLQHLDARPDDRRAEAVHRRARRQPVAGRPERGRRTSGSRSSATTRTTTGIHTLDRKEPLHTAASADFGSPGPVIDFQPPMSHTLVAANNRKKKRVREDVSRGAPAGEPGRDQQRRRLRRHRRSRSAMCSATSSSTSSPRRSRSTVRCPCRYTNLARRFQFSLQGFSQTQFFYGALEGRLLRSGAGAAHQPRPGDRDADHPGRQRVRASIRSTATAGSSCRPGSTT